MSIYPAFLKIILLLQTTFAYSFSFVIYYLYSHSKMRNYENPFLKSCTDYMFYSELYARWCSKTSYLQSCIHWTVCSLAKKKLDCQISSMRKYQPIKWAFQIPFTQQSCHILLELTSQFQITQKQEIKFRLWKLLFHRPELRKYLYN